MRRQAVPPTPCTMFSLFVLTILAMMGGATAQRDPSVCACTPQTYQFQFDFSLSCPPVNVTNGDAILTTTCLVSPFSDQNVLDLVPTSVTSVTILELSQSLSVLDTTVYSTMPDGGPFVDGTTFEYTSYVVDGDIQDTDSVPGSIQFNIIGLNANDEQLTNFFTIQFTNNCDAFPVFEAGMFAGWVRFSGVGEPSVDLCPNSGNPFNPQEEPPTPAPSLRGPLPTIAPTDPMMSMDTGSRMLNFDDGLHEFGN